ncbi:30S ribosomal protein S17 [Candidatus Azambacteria bacterium RIFOXYD1_FULL_42_11]|uniref:Small ribosomal subunit protein uS17 n=4 Tax=Candidatus Azamiibacteriota TaxID=1752741 RepID=A0A0G1C8A2_9BACT|nr:MAG: 30S ribosomal protein S17 [Candidatus Azambacteria bacterium GW2011_GWB1_42_17]KKS45863.1 MAG: 30S ribosomal protein S17 [Candidatus Azambacteria bacterium GW2011_GWA1_42_19]KKS75260.1 MAG: 30S ribosomal protein S17 [Candidatus Azambacteria bacterium GW2011_GWA2_42_9]KKS88331.1 MAG: 30S ribosomal protein S17 [Parcubacteria group bacterium GW2011_GWC1_43_11]OGD41975.1 MAG: 30S ribosomal protein S17 [Candidatus Azambacteria bacterium RIFOXYD1_FULL_42_11]
MSKTFKGTIISDKMNKTVVVKVGEFKKHPRYQRFYKVSKKYKAHDEKGEFHTGNKVLIKETRPISKDKHWVVVKKL